MAFTYKTIGNTAAAVASLFAVGTLLWWQRSPTPIDAPRPQDEAEIMTAVLERHYAMGRTNAAFVRTIPEQTYTVATSNGTRLVTNSPAVSLTNTIGFFPNATFNYPQGIRDALTLRAAPYDEPYFTDCLWILPPTNYMNGVAWDGYMPSPNQPVLTSDTQWWTNWVTLSRQTQLVSSNEIVQGTNGYRLSSNALISVTSTRTDGGNYIAGWQPPGPTKWTIGTAYLENQDGTVTIIDESGNGNNIDRWYDFGGGLWFIYNNAGDFWYSYEPTIPIRSPTVFYGDYEDITFDVAGWVVRTNPMVRQVIVTNVSDYNAWNAGKTFAFERDSKPFTLSTNSYNDMSRALSLMQWQRRKAAERNGVEVDWYVRWASDYANATNRSTVETNITFTVHTNRLSDRLHYGSSAVINGASSLIWAYAGPVPNVPTFEIRISGTYYLYPEIVFTNYSPFTLDYGTIFVTNLLMSTNGIGLEPSWLQQMTPLLAVTNFTIAPQASCEVANLFTPWGAPLGHDYTNNANIVTAEFETAARAFVMAEWDRMSATYGFGGNVIKQYYPAPNGITNSLYLLPDYIANYRAMYGVYHVQFSALTNYANHAPAR